MSIHIKKIKCLLDSDLSHYLISISTGVNTAVISNFRNKKTDLMNMPLQTAKKLTNYIYYLEYSYLLEKEGVIDQRNYKHADKEREVGKQLLALEDTDYKEMFYQVLIEDKLREIDRIDHLSWSDVAWFKEPTHQRIRYEPLGYYTGDDPKREPIDITYLIYDLQKSKIKG